MPPSVIDPTIEEARLRIRADGTRRDDPRQQRDRALGGRDRRASPRTTPRRSSCATASTSYTLPHLIDHGANLRPARRSRAATGCSRSARSARCGPSSAVGSFVCPDDFIALQLSLTDLRRRPRPHRRPASTRRWRGAKSSTAWEASGAGAIARRRRLLADDRAALRDAGRDPADGGPRRPGRDDDRLRVHRRQRARPRLRGGLRRRQPGERDRGPARSRSSELEAQRGRNAIAPARRPRRPCSPELEAVSGADRDRGPPRRRDGRAALQRRADRGARARGRRRSRATRRSTPAARRWSRPLVNGHTHAAMTLFRGYGGDLPLMRWLQEKIWPVEAKLDDEDVYWGARLACAGDDPHRHHPLLGHVLAARRRPPARSPTRPAGDDRRRRCSTPTARPSGCRARRWPSLEELEGSGPGDRPRPRPALDLHRQRGAAALDRRARRRARAAGPDPPLRDRAGGRGLPRGPRRAPGRLPRPARPARRAHGARPRRLARPRRAGADRRARRHRRHQPGRQHEARGRAASSPTRRRARRASRSGSAPTAPAPTTRSTCSATSRPSP